MTVTQWSKFVSEKRVTVFLFLFFSPSPSQRVDITAGTVGSFQGDLVLKLVQQEQSPPHIKNIGDRNLFIYLADVPKQIFRVSFDEKTTNYISFCHLITLRARRRACGSLPSLSVESPSCLGPRALFSTSGTLSHELKWQIPRGKFLVLLDTHPPIYTHTHTVLERDASHWISLWWRLNSIAQPYQRCEEKAWSRSARPFFAMSSFLLVQLADKGTCHRNFLSFQTVIYWFNEVK